MGDKVAFTALAEYNRYLGPNTDDTNVIFNTIVTNTGGGYDSSLGYFTAPVSGIYYFTFTYHGGSQGKTGLQLMKGGQLILQSFDDTEKKAGNTSDNAGHSAILQLEKGDQVFVRLPGGRQVWASDSSTTFSGFLVRRG